MKWGQFFAPATYSGATYGDGDFDPGEIAPEDVGLHEIRRRLFAVTKLATIFGADRLNVYDGPDPFDFGDLPKMRIYADGTGEQESVGGSNLYRFRAIVEVRYDPSATGRIEPGQATVAAVLGLAKGAFKTPAGKHLLTRVGGEDRQLARFSQPGRWTARQDVIDAGRQAISQILPLDVEIDVDWLTGQIVNAQ